MTILALLGSLRDASFNKMLLHAAEELKPEGMTIVEANIFDIPHYDQDIEDAGVPDSVRKLKQQIAEADALLFVTPEYNYSVPGVLKNAIDWASRPPQENPCAEKPAAIMSASTGLMGGSRAQYHLRQICVFLDVYVMNKPEVIIPRAAERFKDGKLIDEPTRQHIAKQLATLQAFAQRLRR
jgi:chromate reductase